MRVNVNLSARPEGEMIEVLHLGVFPNGQVTDVPDEQAETWRRAMGRPELPEQLDISDMPGQAGTTEQPQQAPVAEVTTTPPDQQPPEGVTNA